MAANYYEARNLYEARVARQREERAAHAVARAQAAALPPSPPPPQESAPFPHIRRPLVTIMAIPLLHTNPDHFT